MRFVPIATIQQSDLQAIHRVREQLQAEAIRLGNQCRAFLRENGLVVSAGPERLLRSLPQLVADTDNALSTRMRMLLQRLLLRLQAVLDERAQIDLLLKEEARSNDACQRLMTVPGIGVIGATAMVAAVGNGQRFSKARDLAAWIGLTPQQNSTGGKTKLGGISKRGNSYLRKLLVHGARSVLLQSHRHQDRMRRWVGALSERKHHNVTDPVPSRTRWRASHGLCCAADKPLILRIACAPPDWLTERSPPRHSDAKSVEHNDQPPRRQA